MTPSEIRELILDVVGAKSVHPIEICQDLFDVVPKEKIRPEINTLILSGQLQLTEDRLVRIPIAVCVADHQDSLGDRGLSGLPDGNSLSKCEFRSRKNGRRTSVDGGKRTSGGR